MKPKKIDGPAAAAFLLGAIALLFSGCENSPPSGGTDRDVASSVKDGSVLWSENCMRCHSAVSVTAYSGPEWDVIVHHMRVRANLTAEEHAAIAEFLKGMN